jgi:predicted RNase H-like HicB family nuclease
MTTMGARGRIPVHFQYDEESRNWAFRVDEPRIVGGGQDTLDEARQAAAEAIAYALEGQPATRDDGRTEYLDVAVG